MVLSEEESSKIYAGISHPVRQEILKTLSDSKKLDSKSLAKILKINEKAFAKHIQKLEGFVHQDQDGFYSLTKLGKEALTIMKINEKLEFGKPKQKDVITPKKEPGLVNKPAHSNPIIFFYLLLSLFSIYKIYQHVKFRGLYAFIWIIILTALIYVFIKVLTIRYVLQKDCLIIKNVLSDKQVFYSDIIKTEEIPIPLGLGFFISNFIGGYYSYKRFGKTFVAATNFFDGVLIETKIGKYLITPRNPAKFVDIVKKRH